jgi:Flp pilus assembly protein TadD
MVSKQRRAESGAAMSTIEEVRVAETRLQKVLDALKKADARDPNDLSAELKNATDEYTRAARELNSK